MFFSFTAIDQEGQTRDFFWHADKLEEGFEFLSMVVASGHSLLHAQVLEGGKVSVLPLALFDGLPFAKPIQGLEKEWQHLLAVPLREQPAKADRPPLLACTVFSSTLVGQPVDHNLPDILHHSRHYNARWGITGIMLHCNGHIIQVLEGDEKAIEGLWRRIEQDPRHTHVVRVMDQPIGQPLFGEWSMGYKLLTSAQLGAIQALLARATPQGPAGSGDTSVLLTSLKTLYDYDWLG